MKELKVQRELLILRHGKSDWRSATDDFKRPLKNRGKRAAQKMGVWLQQQNLMPDFILSSPAERALNTAEKLCKSMGIRVQSIRTDKRLYASHLVTLKQVLAECPDSARRILLVGHNPELEELLEDLCDQNISFAEDGKLLPTTTLARLNLSNNWNKLSSGCAQLHSITRPSSLPQGFPCITSKGIELRQRPAYYYSQSAVIPYCILENKLKILIISSSSQQHWLVPKGIIEPGLTTQQSAAKKAWEKAGIEGLVSDQALGAYQYQKWGALCSVSVYPMQVSNISSEYEWKENHRLRKWLLPEKAADIVKEQQLAPLIKTLAAQLDNKVQS